MEDEDCFSRDSLEKVKCELDNLINLKQFLTVTGMQSDTTKVRRGRGRSRSLWLDWVGGVGGTRRFSAPRHVVLCRSGDHSSLLRLLKNHSSLYPMDIKGTDHYWVGIFPQAGCYTELVAIQSCFSCRL